jgi:hypothetical protein
MHGSYEWQKEPQSWRRQALLLARVFSCGFEFADSVGD